MLETREKRVEIWRHMQHTPRRKAYVGARDQGEATVVVTTLVFIDGKIQFSQVCAILAVL